ncbi:hypothetical protein D3C76_1194010 [compost metagenome]
MQLIALAADRGDHLPQIGLHLLDHTLQLTQLILALGPHRALQIPLGNRLGIEDDLVQRRKHRLEQAPRQQRQRHTRGQQRHDQPALRGVNAAVLMLAR